MQNGLSKLNWSLVLMATGLIYILTFVVGLVLSFPLLALLNQLRLDATSALLISSLTSALLVFLVTGYGAWRVARTAAERGALHAVVTGLGVAILSFLLDLAFGRVIEPIGFVLYGLMVAAAGLGGILATRVRQRREP